MEKMKKRSMIKISNEEKEKDDQNQQWKRS
jgi:hypothetical protein